MSFIAGTSDKIQRSASDVWRKTGRNGGTKVGLTRYKEHV
jgi:hypothetical protein